MADQIVFAVGGGTCCCFLIGLIIVIATSFKTVDQSEWCLKYYWWSESVDPSPVIDPGVVMIGLGNYLISFPNTNKYCYFRNFDQSLKPNEGDSYNSPLNVRTSDGLAIILELEFVYRLQQQNLYKLYTLVGDDESGTPSYIISMVHVAMGVIDTWATTFSAKDFYTDRGVVAATFKEKLLQELGSLLYIDVMSFQLQPAHFPDAFANAIVETQEMKQDIEVAKQERETKIIQKQSQLKNQESLAQKVELSAQAEAEKIRLDAEAQAAQYLYRQEVMAQGYAKALQHFSVGMQPNAMSNFLAYMQLEALKAHNSTGKLVRLAPLSASSK